MLTKAGKNGRYFVNEKKPLFFCWLAGFCVLVALNAPGQALAQQSRPSSEAGQIEKRLVKPERPPAEIDAIEAPEIEVAPAPEVLETFVLEKIEVEGATVFAASEFAELYANSLAREISLSDVEALLAVITEKYHKAGYVLSRAVAPPQSLNEGVLRIRIVEGYVERVAGSGTFVSDYRARSDLLEVQNIADEIAQRGNTHSSRVVRQSLQHVRGEVAKALHIEQGTDVFHLLLVHAENALPIQVEDRYVLASFAPDCLLQDFSRVTPSAYLTSVAPLQEAEQAVRAKLPSLAIRDYLGMDADEASLVVIRRTWSKGYPVTFSRLHHPGRSYELTGHYTPPGTLRTSSADVMQLENLHR